MTDLQDLLLDKMVAVEAGGRWEKGPFHLAATLVPGKEIRFTGRMGDPKAKNAIAARLGYPRMLLEAAHGALAGLSAEEDRRALAMGLIQAAEPGKKQKPRPAALYCHAAVAITHRAHGLVCKSPRCSLLPALAGALEANTAPKQAKALGKTYTASCPTYGKSLRNPVRLVPKTPAVDRTVHAVLNCRAAYREIYRPANDVNAVAREAAKAVALAVGVGEALALCAELNRLLAAE
jgi:hypothetical protein